MSSSTPKPVSSRLLTMKFMQRGAASTDPSSNDSPSSKKRKSKHSPVQGRLDTNIDQALIQAAIDQQEAARQAGLKEHSLVDTQWTISNTLKQTSSRKSQETPLDIVYVGYSDVDSSSDASGDGPAPTTGCTSTRKPTEVYGQNLTQKRKFGDDDDSEQGSSNGHEETLDEKRSKDHTLASARLPSLSHAKTSEERSKAKDRQKNNKKVSLNQITSISARGQSANDSRGSSKLSGFKCYHCEEIGHRASDCPKRGSRNSAQKS